MNAKLTEASFARAPVAALLPARVGQGVTNNQRAFRDVTRASKEVPLSGKTAAAQCVAWHQDRKTAGTLKTAGKEFLRAGLKRLDGEHERTHKFYVSSLERARLIKMYDQGYKSGRKVETQLGRGRLVSMYRNGYVAGTEAGKKAKTKGLKTMKERLFHAGAKEGKAKESLRLGGLRGGFNGGYKLGWDKGWRAGYKRAITPTSTSFLELAAHATAKPMGCKRCACRVQGYGRWRSYSDCGVGPRRYGNYGWFTCYTNLQWRAHGSCPKPTPKPKPKATGCKRCTCRKTKGYWRGYSDCRAGPSRYGNYGFFTCYDNMKWRAHGSCPKPKPKPKPKSKDPEQGKKKKIERKQKTALKLQAAKDITIKNKLASAKVLGRQRREFAKGRLETSATDAANIAAHSVQYSLHLMRYVPRANGTDPCASTKSTNGNAVDSDSSECLVARLAQLRAARARLKSLGSSEDTLGGLGRCVVDTLKK